MKVLGMHSISENIECIEYETKKSEPNKRLINIVEDI